MEIAGAGTFDKLAVSQIANLAGPVDVAVIPPYSPPPSTGSGIVSYSLRFGTLALGNIDSARDDRLPLSTAQFAITLNALRPGFGTAPSTVTRLPGGSASATVPGVAGLSYRIQKATPSPPAAGPPPPPSPRNPAASSHSPTPLRCRPSASTASRSPNVAALTGRRE